MKKRLQHFLAFLLGSCLFISCNNSPAKDATATDSTGNKIAAGQVNYPYTIEHPDYWEIGSQQNTMNALSSLKAWEDKNMDASLKYFADSVHVQFDGLDKVLSNDSLKALITPPAGVDNTIKMQDWESVISNDKKKEYVTIWYRQYSRNAKGVTDSVDVINDLEMKDGKIVGLDEYRRKLH